MGDGYVPSPSHFDFESSQFDSPTASVTVPTTTLPAAPIMLLSMRFPLDASQVSYALSASQLAFALNSVNPTSIINSGPVTLQILGDQLETTRQYTLTGPGGAFAASSVQSSDPTVAYAIFNLGGAAAGLYSLKNCPTRRTSAHTDQRHYRHQRYKYCGNGSALHSVGVASAVSEEQSLQRHHRLSQCWRD